MPGLNGTGPEGKGKHSGRKLGLCSDKNEEQNSEQFGKGLGKGRHKTTKSEGKGKRLQSGLNRL